MEISIVRGILTLVLMLAFITLVVWVYARRNRHAYEEAAQLPLEEDGLQSADQGAGERRSGSQQS